MPDGNRARPWTERQLTLRGEKLRLLLVDDNRNAVEALAAYMAFEECECRVALGGLEAIALAIEWAPHVVVMDISMPDCNGYEAARMLRHDPRTAALAIIAFTALDESEVRRNLTDHEFDAYCQKGQAPSTLFALVSLMTS